MRLLDYWPEHMRALREFQALAGAEQREVERAVQAVREAPDDFFASTLSRAGAGRWERLLGLPSGEGGALEDRRFRIMARMNEQLPFTMARLRALLASLCGEEGYTASVDCVGLLLTVRVELAAKANFRYVEALLERVAPLNVVIDLSLKYNQYLALAGFTHGRLAARSHEQLRNEVIA